MKHPVILCFFFIMLSGCNTSPSISVDDVESLTFYTTIRDFETPNAIQSFDVFMDWNESSMKDSSGFSTLCRDTTISSRPFIDYFIDLVNDLRLSRNNSFDLRTAVAINMKDGHVNYIGFGHLFGTSYNGTKMKDDERLFEFLEDSIYSRHPREYWMGEMSKRLSSGFYDFVDDELTGLKAYTDLKVDNLPLFNGDVNGFHKELRRLINYEQNADDSLARHAYVQFIIDKEGRLIGSRIEGKNRDSLDADERRLLEAVDKIQNWDPGTFGGEPVDVFMSVAVKY